MAGLLAAGGACAAPRPVAVPPPPAAAYPATGSLEAISDRTRMILRQLDPDLPPTGKLPPSEVQRIEQAVAELVAEVSMAFRTRAALVPGSVLDGDDRPEAIQRQVLLRLDAIRGVSMARAALRQVVLDGGGAGVDPRPAAEFLAAFSRDHYSLLADWDYAYGDYHPYLHAMLVEVMADGVRFAVPGASFADVEAATLAGLDADASQTYAGHPEVIAEIRTLQIRTWAHLITWMRELGHDRDPAYYYRGLSHWSPFRDQAGFPLDDPDPARALAVARVHLAAADLLVSIGDLAQARQVLGQLAATPGCPLAPHARAWLARYSRP